MSDLSKLKNYVITSNKYNFLLEGYMELFIKNWAPEVHTTILGFDKPEVELKQNFSFHSMGDQDDGRGWCEPLIEFFETCTDDYFLMCFEDHYPIKPLLKAHRERLLEGIKLIEEDKADKLYLQPDYMDRAVSLVEGNWYLASNAPHALVTTSLLPCVWRRTHLLKYLKLAVSRGAVSPHAFETTANPYVTEGRTLLTPGLTGEACIYPNLDAARSGKFNDIVIERWEQSKNTGTQAWMQNVGEDEINVFKRMQKEWRKRYDV